MSGQIENLYKLQKKDASRAGAILADAFRDDPIWRKVFEGESKFNQKYRAFFETPLRHCLKYGEVYGISENLEGIAAWVPGDFADMTFWRLIRSGAIGSGMRMGAGVARKMKPIADTLPADRKENMKGKLYIYLLIIGVASEFQRQGLGGRLLRALIEICERDKLVLYLETETEDNVGMYERFGFTLVKRIVLPDICLPMWEMVREPESAG